MFNGLILKRGDTFSQTVTYAIDGVAQNLTGWTYRAQLRTQSGGLIPSLTCTPLAQSGATLGQFTLSAAPAVTAVWPAELLVFDIEYTHPDGYVESTADVALKVLEDRTV